MSSGAPAEPAGCTEGPAPPRRGPEEPAPCEAAPAPAPAPPGPPAYTVRVSPRAQRASLRMSVDRGLEVVVPRGFHVERIPALVTEKAAWIERVTRRFAVEQAAAERFAAENAVSEDAPPAVESVDDLPHRIELAALDEVWAVEYRATGSARVRVRAMVPPTAAAGECAGGCGGTAQAAGLDAPEPSDEPVTGFRGLLLVSGSVGYPEACRGALRRWLSRRAADHLTALLAEVAREENLSYSTVTVRGQRTRWGSCSSRGAISLNRHLLFLPPHLVRYVLLHELCHTVRPDHSPRFWEEVRRRDPQADRLRKELRVAGRCVPGWARSPGGCTQ